MNFGAVSSKKISLKPDRLYRSQSYEGKCYHANVAIRNF